MIVKIRELYIELDHFPFYMLDIEDTDIVLKMWYDLQAEPQICYVASMDFELWARLSKIFKRSLSRNKVLDLDKVLTN